MKGYVSVEIPVKPYIKAFMRRELDPEFKLTPSVHVIYNKLYDLLERHQNPDMVDAKCKYGEKVKIFVPLAIFRRRGCNLNHTNIRSFNRFVEGLIKHRFHRLMDDLIDIHPTFDGNLPHVRRRLGIDLEAWSDDSMKKDYYRSRLKRKLPLLYKNFAVSVPSEKAENKAF